MLQLEILLIFRAAHAGEAFLHLFDPLFGGGACGWRRLN
jgi:hypothetical protein